GRAALAREMGFKTAALVPVVDRDGARTLAVLILLSERARHYGVYRLRLVEDLASRFGLALEAAQMYQACQIALQDNGQSLATTIHDLMSPLTFIKGTAQRLRRVERSIIDPEAMVEMRRRLEAIDEAANRMASALTALLQTTRPDGVAARPKTTPA